MDPLGQSSENFKMPGFKRSRKIYNTGRPTKRRKRPYRRKSFLSRNVSRIARQVVLRAAESKSKTIAHGKTELYHNNMSLNLHLNTASHMPAQGDGSNGRNGDSIISKGYKIRMAITNKGDRPNVTYRLLVFAARAGITNTYGNVFENIFLRELSWRRAVVKVSRCRLILGRDFFCGS